MNRTFSCAALVAAAVSLPVLVEGATGVRHRTHHKGPRAKGVDVSVYQGHVDWAKAHHAGLSFGVARVSDGLHYHDGTFTPNWKGMKKHGLVRGVYQFFEGGQDGKAQADYLLSKTGKLSPGDIPPMLDIEVLDGASRAHVAAQMTKWVHQIKKKTGLTPIIYTSPGFWHGFGSFGKTTDLWVAHWFVSKPHVPSGWSDWTFWQYSDAGHVSGISGRVDLDQFHGTAADLKAFVGLE